MPSFRVDPARSHVVLKTRAKGLLSALAHDLELKATVSRGDATRDGDQWQGELAIAPSSIKVVGPIKGGKTVPGGMSKIEVDLCEKRIVTEVFAGLSEIVVKARGTAASPTLEITAKKTGPAKMKLATRDDAGATLVEGSGSVSMKSLGLAEVKAPLNAFTVKDEVELEATIALVPA